jgi:polyisoprenoid-binding protein YceI
VPQFDASSAECLVLTYKEGLLSAVAHDLEIRVTRFDLTVEPDPISVRARFDARSLRVLGALRDGAVHPGARGDGDKQKIEHSLVADVLHADQYPEIVFASTQVTPEGEGYRVTGDLTLHGRTRSISFTARPEGERLVAEVRLHQPDFGVKPYSAMLGTLKIKADITVRGSVPRAGLPVSTG